MPLARAIAGWAWGGVVTALGCGTAPCEEDVRAQVLDERVTLQVGDEAVEAELADEPTERERGWMHRACEREGLLLVSDEPGELPVWGCELVAPIDVHWVRDGVVVELAAGLEPCPAPCDGCPIAGEGLVVDAVLETPTGALRAAVGARVSGWQ